MKHTYNISGMTCTGCQKKIHDLLTQVEGVKQVDINLESGEAVIEMSHHVSTASLQSALKDYPKYQLSEKIAPAKFEHLENEANRSWLQTYKPILLIFGYIAVVSLIAVGNFQNFNEALFMRVFMAGFFLVFSFFKMLNLDGFADSYHMYDVIARKFKAWGYLYAFIELFLGLAYAINFNPLITNLVTVIIMGLSIFGVLQSVLNKRVIQCACLGAVFNLPMSTVTIFEDALMIGMGATALIQII